MYREASIQQGRIKLLTGGVGFILIILILRVGYVQIVRHGHYGALAAAEQSRKFEIPAKRGQIFWLDGNTPSPLALNQSFKLLYIDPRFIKNKAETAAKLSAITGDKTGDYLEAMGSSGAYAVLNPRITLDQADKINQLGLAGVGMTDESYRVYPEGQLASQVLGFVNAAGDGQYGVEGYFNKLLVGLPGELSAKTDTYGIPIATSDNVASRPIDGSSLTLTLDRNIQAQAEKYLKEGVENVGAKSGSVIVMDPNSGAIKAMANYPTYDPAKYQGVKDYADFSNAVVSSQFEPGSGFKIITMSAGLDTNKVTPDTTYNDTGSFDVDGYSIHNAENHKFGTQTMTDVIQKSLNTGVMFVLRMLGGDPNNINLVGKQVLYDYITKHFGLSKPTGIEQSGEAAGAVKAPSKQSGNNVTYANMTFGQGIAVTMIQMITAASAIANRGTLYKPYLVDQTTKADGSVAKTSPVVVRRNVISKLAADNMTKMMEQVVLHGSGYLAKMPGYEVAGKTGTAQIPNPDGPGYLEGKNIGSFVGFLPAQNPKFIMMVRIDQPKVSGFAESTTVPVFAKIAHWLVNYYGIPPAN